MSAVTSVVEMADYLASDLYHDADPLDRWQYARAMVSPLRWRVEWCIKARTADTPGPGARVKARIVDPKGREFATCEDADVAWLVRVLP